MTFLRHFLTQGWYQSWIIVPEFGDIMIQMYYNNIQNRAMRYFLGVNKFTPTHTLYGELGWVMPRYRSWLSFAQLWNRLILMNDYRITKKIFLWDRLICCNNWSSEMFEILSDLEVLIIQ